MAVDIAIGHLTAIAAVQLLLLQMSPPMAILLHTNETHSQKDTKGHSGTGQDASNDYGRFGIPIYQAIVTFA